MTLKEHERVNADIPRLPKNRKKTLTQKTLLVINLSRIDLYKYSQQQRQLQRHNKLVSLAFDSETY